MICTQCGKNFPEGSNYCASCGTPAQKTEIRYIQDVSIKINSDISWEIFAIHIVAMFVVAFFSYPFSEDMQSNHAWLFLLIRVGLPAAITGTIICLYLILPIKKKNTKFRRDFVLSCWVILGLIVFGESGI